MRLRSRRSRPSDARSALAELIGDVDLPVFPSLVANAVERIAQPDADLGEVADLISADPGLTVRLLRLANSPASAPRSPIESVQQAVVLLGRNQLEALLMAAGVNQALPSQRTAEFDPAAFWMTAAMRAAAAAEIAGTVMPARRSEMFTAALLQDMAQPILFHTHPDYVELTTSWEGPHIELVARESDAFGWTHAEVGSLMCMHWDLPQFLTEAITVHHDDHHDGFAIVQWAAMVEHHDDRLDDARDSAAARFGIGKSEAAAMLERAAERAGEIVGAFA